jgi:hypothetical protein
MAKSSFRRPFAAQQTTELHARASGPALAQELGPKAGRRTPGRAKLPNDQELAERTPRLPKQAAAVRPSRTAEARRN